MIRLMCRHLYRPTRVAKPKCNDEGDGDGDGDDDADDHNDGSLWNQI